MVGNTLLFQKLTVFDLTTSSKHVNLNFTSADIQKEECCFVRFTALVKENRHAARVGGVDFKSKIKLKMSRIA